MSSSASSTHPVKAAYVCQWCGARSEPAGSLPPGWCSWPVEQAWNDAAACVEFWPVPAAGARLYAWTCQSCAETLAEHASGPRREPPGDARGAPDLVGAEASPSGDADPSPLNASGGAGALDLTGVSPCAQKSEPGESRRKRPQKHAKNRGHAPELPWTAGTGLPGSQGSMVCARCDRRALMLVRGEPLCSWHVTPSLPLEIRHRIHSRGAW